jgi:phosphatidylserine/phosphatidylglycerophosphate/cardiolipin synthase-like enzyme
VIATELTTLFFRTTAAPLVRGNAVRVLLDAAENYPAWLDAIASARHTIHLEMYIVHNDRAGRQFREALVAKAREGVAVRVLYDWFGALRPSSFRFWQPLVEAGGEVRQVNPLRIDTLAAAGSRDHRKLLTVDGRVAYVSGLCIGDDWWGDPERGVPPWRDTGVELRGPAVSEAEYAFASAWATWGDGLPPGTVPARGELAIEGDVAVRVIATSPERTSIYRLELSALAVAQERIWLTDAYFMATPVYLEALNAAARQGVDVRILLPHNSDVPWVANVSRTFYRRLLEAGVRIFEWNGAMLHAKTAVADGRFVRIGSTNLNVSSWIGNWELDVLVENEPVAAFMEDVFLRDLSGSTEIVMDERHRVRLRSAQPPLPRRSHRPGRRLSRAVGGSANRVIKDVALAGAVLGTTVRGYRVLGPQEAASLATIALAALAIAIAGFLWPWALAYPAAAVAGIAAVTFFARSWKAWRSGRRENGRREPVATEATDTAEGTEATETAEVPETRDR